MASGAPRTSVDSVQTRNLPRFPERFWPLPRGPPRPARNPSRALQAVLALGPD